jgi:hypothetical protein
MLAKFLLELFLPCCRQLFQSGARLATLRSNHAWSLLGFDFFGFAVRFFTSTSPKQPSAAP